MIAQYFTPGLWIFLASTAFVLGYLIINQVALRLALMLGSAFYIVYYAVVGPEPLWAAIYGSALMIFTNLIGLSAIYLRNAHIAVPNSCSDIFHMFDPIRPGDFRALMRLGERKHIREETVLSREGEPLDKLYFVISGTARILKRKNVFQIKGPFFVGEVAYLLECESAATTIMPEGSEVIIWDVAKLRRAIARKPRIKLALDAVISKDLANKVWYSVAPQDLPGVQIDEGLVPKIVEQAPANTPAPVQMSV